MSNNSLSYIHEHWPNHCPNSEACDMNLWFIALIFCETSKIKQWGLIKRRRIWWSGILRRNNPLASVTLVGREWCVLECVGPLGSGIWLGRINEGRGIRRL